MQEVDESAPGIWKRLMTSASPEEFFENLDSIEIGAFRVLGDTLVGGNA